MSQNNPTPVELARYAEHFVQHGNQSEAWRYAFPASKAKADIVWRKASTFHKKSEVQEKVAEYQKATEAKLLEEFNISTSDIRKMLVAAAQKGLTNGNNGRPISIQGAVSALAELNRMNGNHAPTKVTGDPAAPIPLVGMSLDEFRQMRQQVISEDDC